MTTKSPRHYAQAYLQANDREAQKAAVKGCPPQWQDLVRLHIKIAQQKAHAPLSKREHQSK